MSIDFNELQPPYPQEKKKENNQHRQEKAMYTMQLTLMENLVLAES